MVDHVVDSILSNHDAELDDQSRLLWHRMFGHFYHENLEIYLTLHNIKVSKCLDCQVFKLKRRAHTGATSKTTRILEIIYSDIIRLIQPSFTGKRFILTFVNDYSRNSL